MPVNLRRTSRLQASTLARDLDGSLPVASAAALTTNLLFQVLRDSGVPVLYRLTGALAFGLILYLAALNAQGVTLRGLFHLE